MADMQDRYRGAIRDHHRLGDRVDRLDIRLAESRPTSLASGCCWRYNQYVISCA